MLREDHGFFYHLFCCVFLNIASKLEKKKLRFASIPNFISWGRGKPRGKWFVFKARTLFPVEQELWIYSFQVRNWWWASTSVATCIVGWLEMAILRICLLTVLQQLALTVKNSPQTVCPGVLIFIVQYISLCIVICEVCMFGFWCSFVKILCNHFCVFLHFNEMYSWNTAFCLLMLCNA